MSSRDRLLETLALPIVNGALLAGFGKARTLQVDTSEKRAEIVLDLKGETEPLRVVVGRYELLQDGDDTFVALHGIATSREWLTALAERFLAGRAVKLPRELAGVLSRWL
jgi:hypothetical protein